MALSPRSARRQTKQPFAFAPQAVASPKLCGRPPRKFFVFSRAGDPFRRSSFKNQEKKL